LTQYSNPRIPEGINDSDTHPLRSFFGLAAAAVLVALLATAVVAFFGGALARYLPYETELNLIAPYAARYPPGAPAIEGYLQGIADRLAPAMALPEGMKIRVHYVDEPVVNAFATLGGHVAVYRGLLERMPDENTLAMVLAHEMGHAAHRDPITSLGRGVALSAAISLVSAGAASSAANGVLGDAGLLTLLSFSRSQEEAADEAGVAALAKTYGHAGGAAGTFHILRAAAEEKGASEPPKFLSTHPLTQDRIDHLAAVIAKGGWPPDGARTPLPAQMPRKP